MGDFVKVRLMEVEIPKLGRQLRVRNCMTQKGYVWDEN
jgi:hypothetical protein